MTTTHLVIGATGQDGVLLSRLLVSLGTRVVGTTTSVSGRKTADLPDIELVELDVRDAGAFAGLVARVSPQVVHNLAAQSSVGASWDDPTMTNEVNGAAVRSMLRVLTGLAQPPVFVQASTSEIFGDTKGPDGSVDQSATMAPLSPYAEAKAEAHLAVTEARRQGMHATNLILFGHTSRLQARTFVLPTLTRQAAEVALGRRPAIELRNPLIGRDWGSAEDFVRAFQLAAAGPPGDYVVATGQLHQLHEIAPWALSAVGAQGEVSASGSPQRAGDFDGARGDWSRTSRILGWRPQIELRTEIERMAVADLHELRQPSDPPGVG